MRTVAEGLERRLGEEGVAGRLVGDGDVERLAGRGQSGREGTRLVDVRCRKDCDCVLALVASTFNLPLFDHPVTKGAGGGTGPGGGHLDHLAGHLVHHEGGLHEELANGHARAEHWRARAGAGRTGRTNAKRDGERRSQCRRRRVEIQTSRRNCSELVGRNESTTCAQDHRP